MSYTKPSSRRRPAVLLAIVLLFLTAGCSMPNSGGGGLPGDGARATAGAQATAEEASQGGEALPDAAPAAATPAASATPVPSATAVPSATPLPTPTPTLHPMLIEAQRQAGYPGSPITVERELERGGNYRRYYAYYLSEGLKIYGLLTIPEGARPEAGWPGIVFNHGYIPPDVYRTTERYIAYVDNLASHGYVVFRIDYRGHDQSEGQASGAYGDPGYLADVLNALASLKQHPEVNPERIGMWGHSMGGYLTLRAMVIDPTIKAGVIWAGVVAPYADLVTRWRRDSGPLPTPNPASGRRWRSAWVDQYGSPETNPDFWNGISANSYLADLSGPIQLHHGDADADVPLWFSELLHEQAQAAGKVSELYVYAGDNHNISNNFGAAMMHTILFFDKFLK